jgi:F0F1-type ATP synthase assembly protein I
MGDLNQSAPSDRDSGASDEIMSGETEQAKTEDPIAVSRFELPDPPEVAYNRPDHNTSIQDQMQANYAPEVSRQLVQAGRAMSAGLVFVMTSIVGVWFGWLLDGWFPKLSPYGIVIFGVLGAVGGFFNMIRLIGIYSDPHDQSDKRS